MRAVKHDTRVPPKQTMRAVKQLIETRFAKDVAT